MHCLKVIEECRGPMYPAPQEANVVAVACPCPLQEVATSVHMSRMSYSAEEIATNPCPPMVEVPEPALLPSQMHWKIVPTGLSPDCVE
jgi:hypothetical protein